MKPIQEAFIKEAHSIKFSREECIHICDLYGIAVGDVAGPVLYSIHNYAASEYCRKYFGRICINLRNGFRREIDVSTLIVGKDIYLSNPEEIILQRWDSDKHLIAIPTCVENSVYIKWDKTPDENMLDGFVVHDQIK